MAALPPPGAAGVGLVFDPVTGTFLQPGGAAPTAPPQQQQQQQQAAAVPPPYYASAPAAVSAPPSYGMVAGPPGGAVTYSQPPAYSVATSPPAYGHPGMTPIAQAPVMVGQQPYYAQPQPYGGQVMMVQPQGYAQGQPQMGYAQAQPTMAYVQAQPQYPGQPQPGYAVAAIPVQVGMPGAPMHGGAGVAPIGSSVHPHTWNDGLCDCCNHPQCFCMMAWFCPWYQFGDNMNAAGLMQRSWAMLVYGIAWICCLLGWGLTGAVGIFYLGLAGFVTMAAFGMTYRTRLRMKYRIEGNQCDDCVVHWFCIPCALAQEARQLYHTQGSPISAC